MKELSSSYGRVFIGAPERCFRTAVFLAEGQRGRNPTAKAFAWALTGGSTPKEWYRWCVAQDALSPATLAGAHWFTSDERQVPLASEDSNFGNADRLLLTPLRIAADKKHSWPVALPAPESAAEFARQSAPWFGRGRCFDVCFLGLGDDGHTASLFPGSPLLADDGGDFFAAIEVPGKGWRLTITPVGLRACGLIVVMALGAGKAEALHRVLAGPLDVTKCPAQVLKSCSQNVVWLVDEPAAARFLHSYPDFADSALWKNFSARK
jgi:6-phosphogluconolactonase